MDRMPDLAAIRATLNTARALLEICDKDSFAEPWMALYERDVDALLAALDAKEDSR